MDQLQDYKHALDEAAIVAITDQKGIITHVNDNFCKISKYDREELLGQDHRIINSGYHDKNFIRDLWKTIANGKVWKGEIKNKAKDGTFYWVDTTIIPFVDSNGKPYQYLAIRADITERKQTEEELIKSLKEVKDYKFALDESSIVAVTNQKGIITYVNNNFCRISQYSSEELIGQDHRIINSGYHSKEYIKNLWQTIAHGKVWRGELKNRAKDGSYYWVDTTIVPFLDAQHKPFQYVAIRSDISERKKAEEQMRDFAKMLETQNKQLVDFCNIISHNLRGPMTNITMLLDMVEDTADGEERMELLSKIRPVVAHLNESFDHLVESLQIKQDRDVNAEIIDINDCLNKIIAAYEAQINEYGAQINISLNGVHKLHYPRLYFESIFSNLISNALKYKSPNRNPVIDISTKKQGDKVLINVKDNGLGLDMKRYADRIFKIRKTFHAHPDAKGFGLFITKTQIEAMGGKIWLVSAPDEGCSFFIELINQ